MTNTKEQLEKAKRELKYLYVVMVDGKPTKQDGKISFSGVCDKDIAEAMTTLALFETLPTKENLRELKKAISKLKARK